MRRRPLSLAWVALAACGGAPGSEEDANAPVLPLAPGWNEAGALAQEQVALIEKHVARVRADPADGELHGTLGLVYQANHLWPEAELAFARARRLDPLDPVWLDHRADALGELGRDAEAWELLAQGAERFADHPPTLQRLGLARLEEGRFEAARDLFEAVVRQAPEAADGHLGLGAALLELGAAAEAQRVLERALEISPGERSGHYLLGRALRALGEADLALAHLERGGGGRLAAMPDDGDRRLGRFAVGPEQQRARANRALAGGRPEEARAILEELAREQPDDPRILVDLGVACSRTGLVERAVEHFRAALELDPGSDLACANLAACELDRGRPAEALAAAERAVELAPGQASGHLMRGRALQALGRPDEARASLSRARELAPGDRLVQRALEELGESPR
jgi:tetratricopeptide (TPR) repeat protein